MIAAAHKRPLKQSEMHDAFEVRLSKGVAVDEFTVYDKPLSPEEVQKLYEGIKK